MYQANLLIYTKLDSNIVIRYYRKAIKNVRNASEQTGSVCKGCSESYAATISYLHTTDCWQFFRNKE